MKTGYERIKTNKDIPAMIAYLDRSVLNDELEMYQPVYVPPHWHRSIELSLVLKGKVELWADEELQIINEGEFLLVNSGVVHHLKEGNAEDTALMMVIISYEFLRRVYPDIDNVYFKINTEAEELNHIKEIYKELIKYTKNPQPLDYIRINGYLYEILYYLVTKCIVKKEDERQNIQQMNQIQKQILNYVDDHYCEEITLKLMADTFGMSEEHFSRMFHKYFGISFKYYLDKYRLYQSFFDIIQSEKPIQQIALEHGFANVKSFINLFKKEYNVTPYQYRKNYKEINK